MPYCKNWLLRHRHPSTQVLRASVLRTTRIYQTLYAIFIVGNACIYGILYGNFSEVLGRNDMLNFIPLLYLLHK